MQNLTDSSLIEQTYEAVPYPIVAHTHSHPDNLAVIAKLHGMEVSPVNDSRILELGCAAGGNLIPMAYSMPGSEFVGVDLSEKQIEKGAAISREADLKNLSLINADLTDLKENLGKFDYIIAHGLYSWVPEIMQEEILDRISHYLSENGLAFVSYNVLPGWATLEKVRDMLLHAVKHFETLSEKAREGVHFLEVLGKESQSENNVNSYRPYLEEIVQQIIKYSEEPNLRYWCHEYLELFNNPVYFSDFIKKCQQAGLQFLAEAEFQQLQDENSIMELFSETGILVKNEIEKQQYLDFMRARKFRQTILCKESVDLKREKIRSRLRELFVTSSLVPLTKNPIENRYGEQLFQSLDGKEMISVNDPVCEKLLLKLAEIHPFEIHMEDLLEAVQKEMAQEEKNLSKDEIYEKAAPVLMSAYNHSKVVNFYTWVPDRARRVAEKPLASRIARLQSRKKIQIVNLMHESIFLDDLGGFILDLLNGQHSIEEIVTKIFDLNKNQKRQFGIITAMKEINLVMAKRLIQDEVELILDQFLKSSLLLNSSDFFTNSEN